MKKPKSICTLKITQPNYLRYQVVAQREYFLHDGYGYSAIIIFLERGRQKKKMVALKEERLKEEKPIPYGDYGNWAESCDSSVVLLLFLLNGRITLCLTMTDRDGASSNSFHVFAKQLLRIVIVYVLIS
jgi:hypothetical protein